MNGDAAAWEQPAQGKYFLGADRVLGGAADGPAAPSGAAAFSPVIAPDRARVAGPPVAPGWGVVPAAEEIRVDVVRENGKVRGLRIACPCGRHAELAVEYPAAGAPA